MSDHVSQLEWTGERMVPGHCDDLTFWEHIARYQFAAKFVSNKSVLDIACGEGYGTFALSCVSGSKLYGVDICPKTCLHARTKYGLDVRCGSAESIPIEDESIDVVVSFETIEHVNEPRRFMEEIHRIMKRDGVLLISSPNKDVYRKSCPSNEFHCSEMSYVEFVTLLKSSFSFVEVLVQEEILDQKRWRFLTWLSRKVSCLPLVWRVSAMFKSIRPNTTEEISRIILKEGVLPRRYTERFRIRPESESSQERARYLLCVCRQPKKDFRSGDGIQ